MNFFLFIEKNNNKIKKKVIDGPNIVREKIPLPV